MNYGLKPANEYLDWAAAAPDSPLNVLAVDQAKFNLSWLAFPEIEIGGLERIPRAFVESIHEYMDKQTRAQLMTLPLSFMGYWREEDRKGGMALAEQMPKDYLMRMTLQAHKAQARLVMREGNVFRPQAWKAA